MSPLPQRAVGHFAREIMPIEFRCTKCSKLLRTPDDTAGKQARCPQCGTILAIPAAAPASPPIAAPLAAPAPAPYYSPEQTQAAVTNPNPYQSSLAGRLATAPPASGAGYGKLEVIDALSRAWKIFVTNMGSCIGIVVLYWVLYIGSMIVFGICIMGGAMVFGPVGAGRGGGGGGGALSAVLVIVLIVGYVLMLLVQMYFIAGQLNFFLKVSRGDFDADVSKIFSGGRWVLPAVGGAILAMICIFVGCFLLIVPGIIVGLMLSQFLYLIIDRNLGVFEAFGESRRITTGNKGMLFLTILLPIVVALVGVLIIPGAVLAPLIKRRNFNSCSWDCSWYCSCCSHCSSRLGSRFCGQFAI